MSPAHEQLGERRRPAFADPHQLEHPSLAVGKLLADGRQFGTVQFLECLDFIVPPGDLEFDAIPRNSPGVVPPLGVESVQPPPLGDQQQVAGY